MNDFPWLAHYPSDVKWDHMIDAKPVYRLLNDAVTRYPNNIAFEFLGKKTTYNMLKSQVNRIAKGLQQLGIRKGDRIGLLLPNCPQFVIAYFAILRVGGIVVQLSPLLSERELEHQINDSGARMLVTLDLESCYGKIANLVAVTSCKEVIVSSLSDALPFPKNILFPLVKREEIIRFPRNEHHILWSKLMELADDEFEAVEIDPQKDIAVIQYTGGTTGVPKGAKLTHSNLYSNALQAGLWCHELEDGKERMLAVLPFFHIFALTVVLHFSLLKGATIIMHPRFELEKVLKDIQRKKPTLMPGVPTMFNAINNFEEVSEYNLKSLKLCVSGGAPLPLDVKEKFEAATGCQLVEGYGLTEASPIVCFNPPFGKQKTGTIGMPFPQTIVEIEDIENPGNFLGPGEIGELCVRGPQVMPGYWNKDDETASILQEGRLRTGDIATMDEEGYFTIVDRLKEMIITGGFNVYPRNVEEAIYLHPAVKEAAVIGIHHDHFGQVVKAFVALRDGEDVTADELRDFLKEKLAKYKVPSEIEYCDELPKTPIGKIDKRALS